MSALAFRLDRVGRAEVARPVELRLDEVGGDDRRGAAQPRALHQVHAVAAAADDEHAVARLHLGAMPRGAHPRRHAAGDQAREIERDVAIDHDDRGLVDHRALAERADHTECADLVAPVVTPAIAAVELRPLRDARPLGAEMMQALPAPAAAPAAGNEGERDMVADGDPLHRRAHPLDHPGRLVAERHRLHRDPALPAYHMVVGAAEADRGDAHQHLGRSGRVEFNALDRKRSAGRSKQGRHREHAGRHSQRAAAA